MSGTHYWPENEEGPYLIEHSDGTSEEWTLRRYAFGRDRRWHKHSMCKRVSEMEQNGYLGVRREDVRVTITGVSDLTPPPMSARDTEMIEMAAAESKVEELKAEIEKLRAEVERIKSTDLDAIVREAITEFRRDVKQPTKAADWAFKWVGRFVEAVEQ